LHISRTEQLERLKARLADPKKNWKLTQADVDERKRWSEYTRAYEDALTRCNTDQAPWRIIPADRKWYRNWALSTLVRAELERMDPKTPPPLEDPSSIRLE
jgi:polyphosphate kinase 2 (PPK2 family)